MQEIMNYYKIKTAKILSPDKKRVITSQALDAWHEARKEKTEELFWHFLVKENRSIAHAFMQYLHFEGMFDDYEATVYSLDFQLLPFLFETLMYAEEDEAKIAAD